LTASHSCGNYIFITIESSHRRDGAGQRGGQDHFRQGAKAVTITRIGTNQKYADGWDAAFGGRRGGSSAAKSKKTAPSKKAAPKKAKKGRR
jgi:hypothetical protein